MKKHLPLLTLAGALAGAGSAQSADRITSAEPTAFAAVTAKLDPGGNLFAYLSTDQWLGGLSTQVGHFRDLLLNLPEMSDRDRDEMRRVFVLIDSLVRHCGVESITGVGLSGIAVEKGLYRTRLVLQRAPGADREGYLWQWFGREPHALDWLDWLPANTAYAVSLDLDLAKVWAALRRESRAAGIPEMERGLARLDTRAREVLGRPLAEVLAGTAGSLGLALVLDPERKVTLPGPEGGKLEIPAPALVLGLKVKDQQLYDTLAGLVQQSAPPDALAQGEADGARWVGMSNPLPLPVSVRPTLGSAGGYLWVSSTRALFEQVQQVHAGAAPGLRSTAEFQRLAKGLPTRGNSLGFVSERFGQAVRSLQEGMMREISRTNPDFGAALLEDSWFMGRIPASLGIGWQDADGAQSVTQGTQHPVSQIASVVMVFPVAVGAGMLMPALAKAKGKAQQSVCANNLKQLALGLILYADAHDQFLPKDLGAIQPYVGQPAVLYCPLDPSRPEPMPREWDRIDPAHCSYDFLTPGAKLGGNTSDTIVLRCRYHGSVAHMDGSVQMSRSGEMLRSRTAPSPEPAHTHEPEHDHR